MQLSVSLVNYKGRVLSLFWYLRDFWELFVSATHQTIACKTQPWNMSELWQRKGGNYKPKPQHTHAEMSTYMYWTMCCRLLDLICGTTAVSNKDLEL